MSRTTFFVLNMHLLPPGKVAVVSRCNYRGEHQAPRQGV